MPKTSTFQEMFGKCLELDKWSVFHIALLCGMFYCIDCEKDLINEDDHQECELRVELRRLIVEAHLGRFWSPPLNLCMPLYLLYAF